MATQASVWVAAPTHNLSLLGVLGKRPLLLRHTSLLSLPLSSCLAAPLLCSSSRTTHCFTTPSSDSPTLTFQQAIQRLQDYWASVGCAVLQSSNTEVGAGTMNPSTFLRVLGPEPWNVAYVEPSIRPDDSRYGDNPNRLQRHTQFQVILKPDPGNSQELYLGSLSALGINISSNDVRFVEDNWESPVLGAWGLGWEVWLNGMEITQFTYFQQAGSLPLMPVSVEITYGLERILMVIQAVDHFRKILYAPGITYGELFMENEKEMSTFYLNLATVERVQQQFDLCDLEARDLLAKDLAIPAYDHVLKASHAFNILDARGALGVTERARFFSRMRRLARDCAQLWVKTRARLEHPLGLCQKPLTVPRTSESVDEATSKLRSPRDFVLEIGSEELPPNDVVNAFDQLQGEIKRLLERRRLDHGSVSIFGTPRRTVVYIKNLAPIQAAIIKDVRGPPCEKAFNEDGLPTKALEGFCKKNGISKDEIFIRTEGKSSYVFATLKDDGMHTIQVLSEELPEILGRISFSKTMRWNSEVSYSRPIRWLLGMHGDVVVPFCFANVFSGNLTRGLRNSATPIIQITQAEDYIEGMQSAGISLGIQEREQSIWQRCSDLAKGIGGRIPAEAHEDLLQEVANLVECPFPLLGSFNECFLELPADVLTMVMRKHQRYFPIEETVTGRLLPAFVVVANGKVDETTVRKGNEAVLRARFEDAKFFYESDVSKPLADFRDRLKGILFQEKLGTMLDKNIRIGKIIKDLGMLMDLDEGSISTAQVAAPLVNADLGTYVVTEFTNLAGVMGRHYALREGQPLSVANAIFESVLPRYAGDDLPRSHAGILLAVADRLDSLVGLFSVGCEPSASADPFGLRRSAYGLVQALVENAMTMDLGKALSITASIQPVKVSESTVSEILTFIIRRLEQLLIDRGANVEIVRAVLSERGSNPMVAVDSVKQLETLSKDNDFKQIIVAYSRSAKLARPELVDISWMVNSDYFQEPEEEALWATYKQIASELGPGVGVGDFVQASLKLVEPLNLFFDNVFVLVEDKTVQKNRLALLRKIVELPRGIVDLSVLPGF